MALEHALLVSLCEQPAAGLELARRFDKSIGFFWSATHQQIYRVLGRMADDGWVEATTTPQDGRRDKQVYSVTDVGRRALTDWLGQPSPAESTRSDFAVRLRGASYAGEAERAALLSDVRRHLADHHARHSAYEQMRQRDYPDPEVLNGRDLDHYLVLRGGLLLEHFWITWLTEYLEAHT